MNSPLIWLNTFVGTCYQSSNSEDSDEELEAGEEEEEDFHLEQSEDANVYKMR